MSVDGRPGEVCMIYMKSGSCYDGHYSGHYGFEKRCGMCNGTR